MSIKWQTIKKLSYHLLLAFFLIFLNGCNRTKLHYQDFASMTEHALPPQNSELGFSPSLADRVYISNILKDNFGPDSQTLLDQKINTRHSELGGPCSIYSYYLIKKDGKIIDPNKAHLCNDEKSATMLIPPPQAVRQGWIIQSCAGLVGKNTQPKTLQYILNRIQAGTSLAQLPAPTIQNFSQLHQLFYRGKPLPSQEILNQASDFFQNGQNSIRSWQNLIYAYCISSQWQLI